MLILREEASKEILYSVILEVTVEESGDNYKEIGSLSDLVSDAKSNKFEQFSKLLSSNIKNKLNIDVKVSFFEELDNTYEFDVISNTELDGKKLLDIVKFTVDSFDFGYDVGDNFDVGAEIPSSSRYEPPEYETKYVSASSEVYVDDIKVNKEN